MNIEDAKKKIDRQTDTCMRTTSTHENVCNSHHHSRMMIRKKKRSRSTQERERGREKKNERTIVYRRAKSGKNAKNAVFFSWRLQILWFIWKEERKKNESKWEQEKIEPVGWKRMNMWASARVDPAKKWRRRRRKKKETRIAVRKQRDEKKNVRVYSFSSIIQW